VNEKLKFERKLLRDWLKLEEIRGHILEEAGRRNYTELSSAVETYVSASSNSEWKITTWFDAAESYELAVRANLPLHEFALLRTKIKEEKFPWEYEGRTWYYWLHLFSSAYGWNEDRIAELDIDTAIGLLQEIMIQEQLEKEWQWSLTELAYPYSETTKKSSFHPLPRPDWMKNIVPRVTKILKRFMPMGNIIGEEQSESKDTKS
jgi:hypothetical protein